MVSEEARKDLIDNAMKRIKLLVFGFIIASVLMGVSLFEGTRDLKEITLTERKVNVLLGF